MTKVVYVPLDERPCNYKYPQQLAQMTDLNMVAPPKTLLGNMKQPADFDLLMCWLESEVDTADYLIVSIDMLIYGGIVPSRLHTMDIAMCLERLNRLITLKENNPHLHIQAFNLIMRTPSYNSSEEEPDYYEIYGEQLYRLGWLYDRQGQYLLSAEEEIEKQNIETAILDDIKEDYQNRRKINFSIINSVIELVDQNVIDYLIIPLDDNSEFGYTATEQRQLMYKIDKLNLMDKINVYPGADEIGCTLFARVFCDVKKYTPEIFIRYSSTNGPYVIPRYEDRSLAESIKSHIISAGGVIVFDEKDNDFMLMVHSPPTGQEDMAESNYSIEERDRAYFSESNIREFTVAIKHYLSRKQHVALADVAIGNGGDHSLLQLLNKEKVLPQLMAYAGWNTNGNTMGTVIAHGIISSFYKKNALTVKNSKNSRTFFYARLIEDWGYQSIVRKNISLHVLPKLGVTTRKLGNELGHVTSLIKEGLNNFVKKYLSDVPEGKLVLTDIHLPWSRMFEVGFDVFIKNDIKV